MFNSNKTVHVNAYTKEDGTQVRDYYRGGGTEQSDLQGGSGLVLQGGVETTSVDWGGIGDTILGVVMTAANIAAQALPIVMELFQAASSGNQVRTQALKPQLYNEIKTMQLNQIDFKNNLNDTLRQMNTAKKPDENTNLLKLYQKQKSLYDRNAQSIKAIAKSARTNDFKSVIEELRNYQTNQQEVVAKNQQERPLNTTSSVPNQIQPQSSVYNNTPIPSPINNYTQQPNVEQTPANPSYNQRMDKIQNAYSAKSVQQKASLNPNNAAPVKIIEYATGERIGGLRVQNLSSGKMRFSEAQALALQSLGEGLKDLKTPLNITSGWESRLTSKGTQSMHSFGLATDIQGSAHDIARAMQVAMQTGKFNKYIIEGTTQQVADTVKELNKLGIAPKDYITLTEKNDPKYKGNVAPVLHLDNKRLVQ